MAFASHAWQCTRGRDSVHVAVTEWQGWHCKLPNMQTGINKNNNSRAEAGVDVLSSLGLLTLYLLFMRMLSRIVCTRQAARQHACYRLQRLHRHTGIYIHM